MALLCLNKVSLLHVIILSHNDLPSAISHSEHEGLPALVLVIKLVQVIPLLLARVHTLHHSGLNIVYSLVL